MFSFSDDVPVRAMCEDTKNIGALDREPVGKTNRKAFFNPKGNSGVQYVSVGFADERGDIVLGVGLCLFRDKNCASVYLAPTIDSPAPHIDWEHIKEVAAEQIVDIWPAKPRDTGDFFYQMEQQLAPFPDEAFFRAEV